MGDWIKCRERMPPSGKPLLVCTPDGVVQRTIYDFDPSDNTWQDWYEQHDPLPVESIGFWQPLPAPPEDV
ncbi:DUF551 domain-containing protein [Pantoea vagans]|uniref:DUF551 domain-containing protein n=1 Tax=Pantoea vagans TaxID=470934 RepID=UPI003AFAEB29